MRHRMIGDVIVEHDDDARNQQLFVCVREQCIKEFPLQELVHREMALNS